MAKLTPKLRRFVDEYLIDLNATQAAIRAGYSKRSASSIGEENLRKPEVRALVDARQAKRAERVEVKADDVLRELQTFGHFDPKDCFGPDGNLLSPPDMPEHARRALQSFDVEEIWEGKGDDRHQVGVVKKVKFWNKPQGLELLGKHIKLFTESIEVKTDELTDEQRADRAAAIFERARAKRAGRTS